jgi:hypothetical protein
MEGRAAVFTSSPQAVEVFQAGAWWAGELLGWRHAADGSCQVQVRVTLGGSQETAWTDLAQLRLPERHLSVAPEPTAELSSTQKLPRAESVATTGMPAVRALSAVPSAPRTGGRRRAPETAETVVAAAATHRSGGRRRAPEDALVTNAPVPDAVAAAASPGRHRAAVAADAGRHRAADTGLFPAVTEAVPAVAKPPVTAPAVPPARTPRFDDTFGGRSRAAWGAVGEPEPELLTRPMRLSDHIPHARRPRLGGSLTSA